MGRKSKADERKLEILGHLYMVMKDAGLEGASIGNVAARMGINPSLIIHYFKSKEEMMVEMVDFLLTQYEATYLSELDRMEDAHERLEFALDAIFGVDWLDVTDPNVYYACYYMSYRNERVRARFAHMHAWFRQLIVAELVRLMPADGPEAALEKADRLAEFIIVLNEGMTYLYGVWPGREEYAKRAAHIREIVVKSLLEAGIPVRAGMVGPNLVP
jgi:AcrR family transcriptional regulator